MYKTQLTDICEILKFSTNFYHFLAIRCTVRQNKTLIFPYLSALFIKIAAKSSVVEPDLEPQGAGTFGRSWSWCWYTDILAPGSGSN
jgi:hypothetical protein